MHPRETLPSLFGLLVSATLVHADGKDDRAASPPPGLKKIPAISILPHGSVLEGVMLPRYDDQRRLVSSLKTAVMTLVNDERVEGEDVTIEMFHPDGTSKARAHFNHAVLDQKTGFLTASEAVNITADGLIASGTGIRYHLERSEGFLLGPAETLIQPPKETTMKSSSSPLRATAALGIAMVTTPLTAAPPAAVSPEELAALETAAASRSVEVATLNAETAKTAAADSSDAAKASEAARDFVKAAEIPISEDAAEPEAKPLEISPGPNDTLIQCDGGMYFDAEEGVLVYLKNVRVTDPRFNLSGANELKIFFAEKTETESKTQTETQTETDGKKSEGFGAGFGDVDRIIATGTVSILQKAAKPGEDPVEASGGLFTYRVGTGEIIISGRYPWVKKGKFYARALQPNLTLRIHKSGQFVTEGKWDMGGNLTPNR